MNMFNSFLNLFITIPYFQMKIKTYNIHTLQMSVIQMEREKAEVYYVLIIFPQCQINMYILIVNINLKYIVSK